MKGKERVGKGSKGYRKDPGRDKKASSKIGYRINNRKQDI
jgi:hypothetical protein